MRELRMDGRACLAAILAAAMPTMAFSQQTLPAPATTSPAPNASQAAPSDVPAPPKIERTQTAVDARRVPAKDRRRAAKLYLQGTKLFERSQFERAIHDYDEAADLDPSNKDYALAQEVARSHAVTALIQQAAQARTRGDIGESRAALQRARDLDPKNPLVAEHMTELADTAIAGATKPLYEESASSALDAPALAPLAGLQSFHLKLDRRTLIQRVYKAYGIDATLDQSVQATPTRFDSDNISFNQAVDLLNVSTNSFDVPLDAHRVLIARDTRENRTQFLRQQLETIYLPGMSQAELTEVSNIAKNVFAAQQVAVEQTLEAVTVRAPAKTLDAFNATMRDLVGNQSQVLFDVRIIQLAHSNARNTGAQLPQQVTAFNVFTEEQQILNANQALVQQIISSGLAAPGDNLAILGILLASGAVSSSIFSNGIALFGGGITTSGLSPGPAQFNLNLNSSESKELDAIELRLADGQDESIMSGARYPILTASYSSGLGTNGVNIPGLTSAGSSSGLSALLSSVAGSNTQIPQVQYQDIGLTLKTTPKVMRSGDVALTLDLKITALSGGVANDIPILNNRSYSGVITLKSGEGVVLLSELDKSESLAVSGTPGLSEIPGLNNVTDKNTQQSSSTLLIVLTPHLVVGPHYPSNPEQIFRIERSSTSQ